MRASDAERSELGHELFLPLSPCGREVARSHRRRDRVRGTVYPQKQTPHPTPLPVKPPSPTRGEGAIPMRTRITCARSFDTPLPIDAVLDQLSRTLADNNAGGAGGASRRRQDHAGAAGAARCAVAAGQEDHHAGAAPDRGPRQRRAHGEDAGRARRRNRRLPRPVRLQGLARHQDRGRHRGHFFAADSRRSGTDRRRRGAVRRIPRALARCRSRAGAGARRAGRPARGSAHSRDVGDARRRAGRKTARRCAGHIERRPRLSGGDPLSRPQGRCAAGAADGGRDRDGAARRSRLGAGVPAGGRGNPPHPEFSRRTDP